MAWLEFAVALAAFYLSHALPVRPPLRPWLVDRIGPRGFALAYSALSLLALAWAIGAAARAPHVPLWSWAPWQNGVTLAAMAAACLVLALATGRPNPFSFGGRQDARFDPARPGIVRLTRHPLLAALALWAGGHMVANGDLAHVLLFGGLAGFALSGMRMIDRRRRPRMGAEWQRLAGAVGRSGFRRPGAGTLARLAAGGAIYGLLLWAHPFLFGVTPLP